MNHHKRLMSGEFATIVVGLLALVFSGGCSNSQPPGYDPSVRFLLRTDPIIVKLPPVPPTDLHPNGKLEESIVGLKNFGGQLLEPSALPKNEIEKLTNVLEELFGTPATPKLAENPLGVTPEKLVLGSRVYKEKCANCHGINGDGRGPTGAWVYPHPRDFRLGKSKYVTSPSNGTPTREDLAMAIRVGIAGNSMPSFALLPPEQLEAVIDYTIFLSVRGKVETELLSAVMSEEGLTEEPKAFVEQSRAAVLKRIAATEPKVLRPTVPQLEPQEAGLPSYDDRIRRGFQNFTTAGCASCHTDYGRDLHYLYDDWGVAVPPANLSLGKYRGGGESLDLFRRIRCGIPPSGMPAVSEATLADDQVWDLVLFLKALPVPRQLPNNVRAKIYGN
jgi:mono/diheme cytochrome c family protein